MSTSLSPTSDGLYTLLFENGGRPRTFLVAGEFITQTLGIDQVPEGEALTQEQLDKLVRACRDAAVPQVEDLLLFSAETK